MKFLIIEQDLRVSGTSQGIISRSFLAKLRIAYPKSIIDVVYLKHHHSDDQLDLLPIDSIETHVLNLKIPFFTKWLNKVYWRLFHISLKERYIHKVYGSYIAKVDYLKYDHIFIRSTGLDYEAILGSINLPILKKAIINFHEPYPTFWCAGSTSSLSNLELFRMKQMQRVVEQAKACMGTHFLARDMQFLYGSRKQFYTLPHQYVENVFDLKDKSQVHKKSKKVTITYHGAIQFGRNIDILLDCYKELIENNATFKENTEFVLRLKSSEVYRLRETYLGVENIKLLESVNFSSSAYEQKYISDINILLENGPIYCSVLLGKAPFLATIEKPVFSLSPNSSEMRVILKDQRFIEDYKNKEEIKNKLENLITGSLNDKIYINPFGNYFSDETFKKFLDKIL
jgi:hypothetical protein